MEARHVVAMERADTEKAEMLSNLAHAQEEKRRVSTVRHMANAAAAAQGGDLAAASEAQQAYEESVQQAYAEKFVLAEQKYAQLENRYKEEQRLRRRALNQVLDLKGAIR